MNIKIVLGILLGWSVAASGLSVAQAEDYQCGAMKVTVKHLEGHEGGSVQVDLKSKSGTSIFPRVQAPGKFLALCKFGVFALVDNNVHSNAGSSYLLRADGSLVSSYAFEDISYAEVSPTQKYFWVVRFEEEKKAGLKLYTNVTVVDYKGAVILNKRYDAASEEKIIVDGDTYTIEIPEPDFP